jgi:hypothetical protein
VLRTKYKEIINHLSFQSKAIGETSMKTAQYTKALTVSLRPEIFVKIKQITDERQISIAEWIRDALENQLLKFQQPEKKEK